MMQETNFNDAHVIGEILNGDKNKYSLLMQKYNQRLYRICRTYIKDEAEIEDVMQETYIKAFVGLPRFAGRSSFSTWLSRILINESLQRLRSLKKTEGYENRNGEERDIPATDNINPEKKSMNKELRDLIEQNIEALPENYRIVFLMREVEKVNVAETAEILSLSETNVKVRLNRAKEMLRKSLLQSYPLEELYEFNLVRCARIAGNVMLRLRGMGLPDSTVVG